MKKYYCDGKHKFVSKVDCDKCYGEYPLGNCYDLRKEKIYCYFCKKEITEKNEFIKIDPEAFTCSRLYYKEKEEPYDLGYNLFCSFECFLDDIKTAFGLI